MRPTSPRRTAAIVAVVLVVAAGVAVAVVLANRSGKSGPPAATSSNSVGIASDVAAQIPAADGVTLIAEVVTPKGSGPFPLVIMPASWGQGAKEYTQPARRFAAAGYEVVAYGQRGFGGSGGLIDFGGEPTRADASTVIDWALQNTPSSKTKIASVGISYGAGISLLAAAHDPRIRAVVAMSGWSDLAGALAPSGTPNVASLTSLLAAQLRAHKLTQPVANLAANIQTSSAASLLAALSPPRSAVTSIAQLNANKPAIMIANAYEDSVLNPAPMVPFFDKLTTPKRLQLAPGDHGGPELPALSGRPDRTVDDALKWVDHYLRGASTGIADADPIQLEDGATGTWHGYKTWPAANVVRLGTPNTSDDVSTSGAAAWSRAVPTGSDTTARSGSGVLLGGNPYQPPKIAIGSVTQANAFVWTAAPLRQPLVVSGRPTLRITPTSSTGIGTLYAYLYDVDGSGSATLVSFAPYTFAAGAGAASIPLGPTSWTVPAGHHLALVVDTVDARYRSAAPAGSTLTLTSTDAAPATLAVPVGS